MWPGQRLIQSIGSLTRSPMRSGQGTAMPVAQVADWPAVPAGLARCAIAKAGAVLDDRRARQRAARRRHPQSGDERVEREIHPRRNHPQAADEVEPGDGEQQSWRKRARPRRPRARADSRRWCRNTRLPDLLRRAQPIASSTTRSAASPTGSRTKKCGFAASRRRLRVRSKRPL